MKKSNILLTISAYCLLSYTSYAQSPNWLWARGLVGSGAAVSYGVAVDASGNSYITGQFTSSIVIYGLDTLTNTNSTGMMGDVFLTKYDVNGNVLWAKSAGGPGYNTDDYGFSVAVDANGNVYLAGVFNSPTITFGSWILTNTNSTGIMQNLFLTKYDVKGNVLWAKSAGGPGTSDAGAGVAVDGSGNAYVTGSFCGPALIFGPDTLTCAGVEDYFLVKYDEDGNILWAKSAGGTGDDDGAKVAVDTSGDPYVIGYFSSPVITFGSDTLTSNTIGFSNMFLVKYDAGGNVLWAKSAGGPSHAFGWSVAIDAYGNAYVTGIFYYQIIIGPDTLQGNWGADIFSAKYDANGNVLWAKSAGGTSDDYGLSFAVDASGDAYLTGYFQSPSITFGSFTLTDTTANPYDMFVVIYSPDGDVLWATNEEVSLGYSIAVDAFENAYVTGVCGLQTVFGSDTCSTLFLAKLEGIAVGVNELNRTEGILVYPNPAANRITVKVPDENTGNIISIVDIYGQPLLQKEITGQTTTIDISTIPKGMYFVKVPVKGELLVQKFIKE